MKPREKATFPLLWTAYL